MCTTSTTDESSFPARECIFPFDYKGKQYNECVYKEDLNHGPWCPYDNYGEWGVCDPGCPGIGTFINIFEFQLNFRSNFMI